MRTGEASDLLGKVEHDTQRAISGGLLGLDLPPESMRSKYMAPALDFIGKQHKKDASKAKVTCAVSIGPRDGGGFGLAVKLRVEDKSLPQAELATLAREAHEKICPYSHATRDNVNVQFEVVGA